MDTSATVHFASHFRHALDDKNRLTIPSGWRAAFGADDVFLAVPNPDGYVSVLPPAEVEKLKVKVAQVPLSDAAGQAQIAAFFAASQTLTFDKQGRIALGDWLLKHAQVAKEAVLVGMLNTFNIYSAERWDVDQARSSPAAVAAFMQRFGI